MANVFFKGNASVEGISGSFDVIVWLPQTGRFADNFEEETVKDQHGYDTAWLARNQHLLADVGMKVVGMNSATKASLLAQNYPLLPLTTVTLSGFLFATDPNGSGGLNGQYQYMSGADLNLSFDKVTESTFKLRKYMNTTQNALANTTPS
jgi:hypothetical protein